MDNNNLKETYRKYLQAETRREKNKIFESMTDSFISIQDDIFKYLKMSDKFAREDIRQEVLIKIFLKITPERLDSIRNLVGYINVITLNETKMYLRGSTRYAKYLKRLKIWTEESGLLWRVNYTFSENFPQSILILPRTIDFKRELDA